MKYFQKLLISLKKAKYKNKKKKNKQLIEMNECVEHLKLERNNFKNGNWRNSGNENLGYHKDPRVASFTKII